MLNVLLIDFEIICKNILKPYVSPKTNKFIYLLLLEFLTFLSRVLKAFLEMVGNYSFVYTLEPTVMNECGRTGSVSFVAAQRCLR